MQRRVANEEVMPRFYAFSLETLPEVFAWFGQMRAQKPVWHDRAMNVWHVFRYDDVSEVLTDYTRFSSEQRPGTPFYGSFLGDSVVSKDPPDHRKLRNLVNLAFTPRALARLSDRISEITGQLLDQVRKRGRIDIVEDIAFPLPAMVIAEMLGVPPKDWDIFRRWASGGSFDPTVDPREAGQIVYGMQQQQFTYFSRLLEDRRRSPREDLISVLSTAEIDGERLSEKELVNFCILLLAAGQETTKNLIANAMLCFTDHAEVMEQLRRKPDLMPDAIEEVLRYLSPIWNLFRLSKTEVELGGQRIGPDEIVLAWPGSANRDPDKFSNPDQFDINRNPNPHLSFGHGIHYCLGAPLARLEAKIALPMLLERLPDLKRVPNAPVTISTGIIFEIHSLPMFFSRR